jgi:hypothetical protein
MTVFVFSLKATVQLNLFGTQNSLIDFLLDNLRTILKLVQGKHFVISTLLREFDQNLHFL